MNPVNTRSIYQTWIRVHPQGWWGDWLDVRFYLISKLKHVHSQKILDVACNAGILLSEIPNDNKKYGIDVDDLALKAARKLNPKATLKKASMFHLPFPASFFDIVVLANVLPGADFAVQKDQRMKFQKKLIAEVRRVLKPAGTLYLTTPNNAYYHGEKETYEELYEILNGWSVRVQGWNPFPSYPRFFPARILAKVPFWFQKLAWLSEKGVAQKTSKFFYAEARKVRRKAP